VKTYNGAPALVETLPAGTMLWRVHRTDIGYPPHSFNATHIAPLVDALTINPRHEQVPRQGRFEPVHDELVCPGGSTLGGYLYVGLSEGAAVAEGVLRGKDIPSSRLLPASTLHELSITRMRLTSSVSIAALDSTVALTRINQDTSLTGCSWREYRQSRIRCTQILLGTPRGIRRPIQMP
jgi:hypothetical protein